MSTVLLVTLMSFLGSDQTGTVVLPLLKIGQGARAGAMGESFTALADDATAIYWNPAGLGQLAREYNFVVTHHEWFVDTRDELVHAALPVGPGALGLSLVCSSVLGIKAWDEQNQPGDTFGLWSVVASGGYGLPIGRDFYLGASVKGLFENLRTSSGFGGGIDLGAMGRPMRHLTLGIAARNLGVAHYGSQWQRLPWDVGLGASFTVPHFTATADATLPRDNWPTARIGIEVLPIKELALRLGYRSGPIDLGTLGWISGLTAGIGINIEPLSVDYALAPYGALGLTHRIGIRIRLNDRIARRSRS